MLEITKRSENGIAYLNLKGELDTLTATDLSNELDGFLDDVTDMTVDLDGLGYITSAGLRVLLAMEQTLEKQGSMKVINVCDEIMEIFELTGFTEVLTIQ